MALARSTSTKCFLVFLLATTLLWFAGARRALSLPPCAEPISGVLTASDPRWQGGDGAFSVPLETDRRLWLFGDTWVSSGQGPLSLVSNTIGIQTGSCERPFDALWRQIDGKPAAFFRPSDGVGWLWPAGGSMVGEDLYLFFHHMARRPPGGQWDFIPLGTSLFRIPNPGASPQHWILEGATLPWPGEELLFAGAPQVVGRHLWAFATRPVGRDRTLVLARIALEDLEALRMDRWSFLLGDGPVPRWTALPGKALGLFHGVGTELTVARASMGGGWICIYTPGGISSEVLLRRAPHLQGPWEAPIVLYRCPEAKKDPNVYCYGAKLHAECARGHKKVHWITYTVNTRDGSLPGSGLFRPRWVRIPTTIMDCGFGISD